MKYIKTIIKKCLEAILGDYIEQSDNALQRFLKKNPDIYEKCNKYSDDEITALLLTQYNGKYRLTETFSPDLLNKYEIDKEFIFHQVRKYKIRMIQSVEFLKKHIDLNPPPKIIDVGDNSGFLINALTTRKNSLSVNIDKDNVSYLEKKGMHAIAGDIHNLPLSDKSFDYAISFECIEHVSNPIGALKELARITKRSIFISIPYVPVSRIANPHIYNDANSHIFELSKSDFIRLVEYAGLTVRDHTDICASLPLLPIYSSHYYHDIALPIWTIFKLTHKDQ